jgi:uncharacterized protein (UPF0305 family)
MPDDAPSNPGRETEARLRVGWQRLTKQEFVEALTAALMEKVRDLRGDDSESRARARVAGVDSAG